MNYSPNDLQNLVFKKSVMGYNEDMVNEVLDKVIEDYTRYIRENIELKDKTALLNEGLQHYKTIEETLQNSILLAQQVSDEAKKNAYEKAENILKEAEMKAQKIIDEANNGAIRIKREYEEFRNKIKLYRSKCESIIHSQLEMLRQLAEDT